jgi:hypothetical protein
MELHQAVVNKARQVPSHRIVIGGFRYLNLMLTNVRTQCGSLPVSLTRNVVICCGFAKDNMCYKLRYRVDKQCWKVD